MLQQDHRIDFLMIRRLSGHHYDFLTRPLASPHLSIPFASLVSVSSGRVAQLWQDHPRTLHGGISRQATIGRSSTSVPRRRTKTLMRVRNATQTEMEFIASPTSCPFPLNLSFFLAVRRNFGIPGCDRRLGRIDSAF